MPNAPAIFINAWLIAAPFSTKVPSATMTTGAAAATAANSTASVCVFGERLLKSAARALAFSTPGFKNSSMTRCPTGKRTFPNSAAVCVAASRRFSRLFLNVPPARSPLANSATIMLINCCDEMPSFSNVLAGSPSAAAPNFSLMIAAICGIRSMMGSRFSFVTLPTAPNCVNCLITSAKSSRPPPTMASALPSSLIMRRESAALLPSV